MGGSNGNSNGYAGNVVQYAQIPSGGGATYAWHTTNSLAVPTLSEGCVTANGYIYCVGGDSAAYDGSYLATVQYAKILSGGGTSTWTSQSDTLYLAGSGQSCVTENNYIYCYGSYPGVAVQYATVPSNGGPTSAWTSEYRYYPYLDTQSGASCVTANGYLYCMGDDLDGYYVHYTPVLPNTQSLLNVQNNYLAVPEYSSSCVTLNNNIFCMGGNSVPCPTCSAFPNSTVQSAQIPLSGGSTYAWTKTANVLAFSTGDASCVTANNYIYCMGGNWNDPNAVQYASVLPYTATTTSLSSSQNPSTYRASVTLTASVTSLGAPAQGGNVAFYDGANLIGTVVLTNGAASLATSVLSVGSHSITATYLGSANYTSSTSSALVEAVSPAPLTITASSPTITYGESVPAITASYSGFVNGESASSFTTAPTCSAGIVTSAGTYTATCSGAVDSNYAITYVSGTLTVNSAPLTITASSPTITYGGSVPAITASYSGFVNGDSSSSLTTAPACSVGTVTNAGTYTTTCLGAVDGNYIIAYNTGTLTVNTVPLTITASSPSMTYGGTVPAITALYGGFVNGDSSSSLTTAPTCSVGTVTNAGTYTTTCSGAVDSNYAITYVSGILTVNTAPLTITASSPTITYGVTPVVTASYTGLQNGDAAPAVAPSCSASGPFNVGTYTTTCSGAVDSNYAITYVSGILTVNTAPLTITASSPRMTYGGTVPPRS